MRISRMEIGFLVSLLVIQCAPNPHPASSFPPHHTNGSFRNINPAYAPPDWWSLHWFILTKILQTTFAPRTFDLPAQELPPSALHPPSQAPTATWVGHATLLVHVDGVTFLTDPQWSDRASPVSFAGPTRVSPPGIPLENLPPVHLVIISHNHYDHLDLETVKHLAAAHDPLFLVPLGLKAWFQEHSMTRVEELDWWEQYRFQSLTVVCLPAQHFSGRTMWDRNKTLWSSWAVMGAGKRFFFSGDTGYYPPMFKEIGERVGPFDLAAISIGAYRPRDIMRMTHLTPEEALHMYRDLQGRKLLGIHWGTFDLTEEPFDEPPARLQAEAQRRGLDPETIWVLNPGDTRHW